MVDAVLDPPRSSLPRGHSILMLALLAMALVAGYSLLPGDRDRVAMLDRDGQKRAALETLERRFKAGDMSQQTIYQLQELYEQVGNLEAAQRMLELLANQRPRDSNVQRRLATFYKSVQNQDGYINSLHAQVQLRYSDQACKELIGLRRLVGDAKAEKDTISLCRQKGYRRTEDLVRLASLQLAHGETQAAVALLKGLDDVRRLRNGKDRFRLFELLLDADQPREANRRASRWVKVPQRDEAFAMQLIERLAEDNHVDLALDLARDASTPGDPIALMVAELMLQKGQGLAARSYLRGWFEKAEIKSDLVIARFVLASLAVEDTESAFAAVRRFGVEKTAQQDLVALAEALAASGQMDQFNAIRPHLQPETLGTNPLLGAAVQLSEGAPQQTRRLLASVQIDQLDEWRLSLWTRLMQQTGATQQAAEALRELGVATPAVTTDRRLATTKRLVRPAREKDKEKEKDKAKRLERLKRAVADKSEKKTPPQPVPKAPTKSVFDTQSVFGGQPK